MDRSFIEPLARSSAPVDPPPCWFANPGGTRANNLNYRIQALFNAGKPNWRALGSIRVR
jgi:hypothetical protein